MAASQRWRLVSCCSRLRLTPFQLVTTASSKEDLNPFHRPGINPISSPLFQAVEDQQGSDGLTYKVFSLHLPPRMNTKADVDADVIQDESALTIASGKDGPGQTAAWDGSLEPNTTLQIPVAVTSNMPSGATLNLMLRWYPEDGSRPQQRELTFVPIVPGSAPAQIPADASFYDAVQAIAAAYQVTIFADPSALLALPNAGTLGTLSGSETNAQDALKSVLGRTGFLILQKPDGSYQISHPS